MYLVIALFFLFKQKTAYEMRISDWSSDVCSSDLRILHMLKHVPKDDVVESLVGTEFFDQRMHHVGLREAPLQVLAECARTFDQGKMLAGAGQQFSHHTFSRSQLQKGAAGQIALGDPEIGSASGRERVCQYV